MVFSNGKSEISMNPNLSSSIAFKACALWLTIGATCGFCQESKRDKVEKIFQFWGQECPRIEKEIRHISYKLETDNEFMIRSGPVNFYQLGNSMAWHLGQPGAKSSAAFARNSQYSFLLQSSLDKEPVVGQLKQRSKAETLISNRQVQMGTIGASCGFLYLPVLYSRLSDFPRIAPYLILTSTDVSADSTTYTCEVDTEKLKADVNRITDGWKRVGGKIRPRLPDPEDQILFAVVQSGLYELDFEIDSSGPGLPSGFRLFFLDRRPPITAELIHNLNKSGYRQADGSAFPDSMAEPEGNITLRDAAFAVNWEFQQDHEGLKVSAFRLDDIYEYENPYLGFSISDIHYDDTIPEEMFRLPAYGVAEPEDVSQINHKGARSKSFVVLMVLVSICGMYFTNRLSPKKIR